MSTLEQIITKITPEEKVSLTKKTEEVIFFDYCVSRVSDSISKGAESTSFNFYQSKEMKNLGYIKIEKVYKRVEAFFFNKFDIGLSFGGQNSGTSVGIYYLKSGKYSTYFDIKNIRKDDNTNFFTVAQLYLDECLHTIKNFALDGKTVDLDTSLGVGLTGYMWDFMYYFVSQQLVGWSIKKNIHGFFLLRND